MIPSRAGFRARTTPPGVIEDINDLIMSLSHGCVKHSYHDLPDQSIDVSCLLTLIRIEMTSGTPADHVVVTHMILNHTKRIV